MKKYFILALLLIATLSLANQPEDVIPFKVINGHISVQIIINDKPHTFVFDTGAATNLLSDQAAEDLGLDLGGNMNVQGAAGSSRMKIAKNQRFTFGKTEFKKQNFAVMDISHLGEEGSPIDGVLGASILGQYVVEIDYDQKEIKLFNSIKGIDTSAYQEYSYSLSPYRIPIIESTIELDNGEQITGKYFVDTGAALSIMVNSNLVKKKDLISQLGEHYPITSTSLSNSETDQVSLLPKFTLFDKNFENFSVRLSQATQGVNSFKGYDGIIGFYLLRRFNTIFDYDNERMYVKPNQSFEDSFPRNYSGLQVRKRNGFYEVVNVAENSVSADVKIQNGDIVERLDGQTFETRAAFYRYFQDANKPITLELSRNGEVIELELLPRPTIN